MAAQAGKDMLLKLDQTGSGTFETVAGLRSRRFALNAVAADITNADSAGRWRELLAQSGTRSASLSGAGVFRDAAADSTVREVFFSGTFATWQVVLPDFGVLEGPFQISGLEYSGQFNGEITYEISLESAGQLTFSPSA
ncbi:phage major tail protein, TP901-1 family [Pseudovibrio exalbescens]|uniref:phage major tail protein, TP901-1 family n=1 Tax=Pseudovibrio exalbescens TaxID=197461 RepID=UPI0023656A96|nr:phage major tail protein, TP901-1 family [Pseudovibrio exalbescens]MDD7909141.1 phage major tail protein, TP901-1 family [Pseudovibrio exalbescens]